MTATIHPGYTGAGIFPGRCLGLAIGIGEFQPSHWVSVPWAVSRDFGVGTLTHGIIQVWWVPDILAAAVHALLHMISPTHVKPPPGPANVV